MLEDVGEGRLVGFGENQSDTLAKSQVLLFCMKHPGIRLTAECISVKSRGEQDVLW